MVIKVKYNGEWVKIPYLSSDHGQELVEEAPKDNKQYARQDGTWTVVNIPEVDFTEVYEAIDTKVDKVDGKGLSTNDYITADKTKVTNVNEVIEAAAKSVTATGISITLDKRNLVTNAVENIELDLPASTTALAGLMLPSDKTKLNGIAAGAEVNVNADWNATEGDALILNKPTIPTVDVNKEYVDTQLATKSDLPDYTVFDIVMEISSSGNLSISQENYNKLLEKLPSNAVNIFPVRDNGRYISSLFGGYNVNDDNSIWFYIKQDAGILQNSSAQISIYQDLSVNVNAGMNYLMPVSGGIDVYTNLISGLSENNTKQLTIHTTGIDFIGYVFYHDRTLLRKDTKKKFIHKLSYKSKNKRLAAMAAYWGWCKYGNCHNLWYRFTRSYNFKDYRQKLLSDDGIKESTG